ncbi:IclR family transcriptional regulator [Nonomuraea diastatica]|uniref:Glycerol operon regulatory protein n=1 Tax=Nonomuraea diastatica TaxID=1848329 RepID=A0A4R4W6G8_9ACTN|nr:IclR family transcriptional regulator [Nonomuraea diastatica]TDD14249.1 IclR family transcriptional regulator [Nonomuraea diastatica]
MTQHVSDPLPEPAEAGGGVRSVKSAERTIAVLEYLSSADHALSLREVTTGLCLPRASAYALLATLVNTGWIETDDAGRYRIGLRALRAGASYVEHDDVVKRAQTVMNELNIELGETIHLARLDGAEIVYLATNISRHSLAVISRPGRRLPSWATGLGKAILAGRPWDEVDQLLPETLEPRTVHTFTDRAALRTELEEIRRRGHAIDEQESTIGLRCFAVALDFASPPNEALSCSVPVVRLDADHEEAIVTALLRARTRIIR